MEAKLKHLEFIQAAIARMATSSSLFKGWAVTIAAALSAFSAVNTRKGLLAISLVSTAMLWGLDGYYLWLERGFVALHREVAKKSEEEIDFSMRIDKSNAICNWIKTCVRHHLIVFYGTIIIVEVVGIVLIKGVKK